MIKISDDEKVIIDVDKTEYCLKDKEQYKQFVIKLTDPTIEFDMSSLEIDGSIQDPRLRGICEKYKQFFTSYLEGKKGIIEKAKEEFSTMTAELNETPKLSSN